MQAMYDDTWSDYRLNFNRDLVYKLLGMLIYMSMFNLDNVSLYWKKQPGGVIFPLMDVMSEKSFWRIFSVMHFSGRLGG